VASRLFQGPAVTKVGPGEVTEALLAWFSPAFFPKKILVWR
jgi:hypothetical protein